MATPLNLSRSYRASQPDHFAYHKPYRSGADPLPLAYGEVAERKRPRVGLALQLASVVATAGWIWALWEMLR